MSALISTNSFNVKNAARMQNTNIAKSESYDKKTEKEHNYTAAKVVLAGLTAAGIIAAAVVSVRRAKSIANLKEEANSIKKYSVDAFKEAGNKFVKGNALTKDGEPFTGIIEHLTRNGSRKQMEYVDGVLQEVKTSIKTVDGHFIPSTSKKYVYNAENKLSDIEKYSYGHVSHLDPQKDGFQYIKKEAVNLKEKRIKAINRFGADKCVSDKYGTKIYFKDGKKYVTEKTDMAYNTNGLYSPSDLQIKKDGITYRQVETTFHDTGLVQKERVYSTGEKDVLLNGEFSSSDYYVKRLNKNGETTGFIKSSYISEQGRNWEPHGVQSVTNRIKIEEFDANGVPIKSYNTVHNSSDYSRYDWD